ncbi:MAG: hypothetical protein DME97_08420 [Verrucomicrobia bacterium]|nr:MAG: hypothetical protein DME97_08420 [Verrucomicrobiota bacterium]
MKVFAQKQNRRLGSTVSSIFRLPSGHMQTLQRLQTKLKTNVPGDACEREADHIAEEVSNVSTRSLVGSRLGLYRIQPGVPPQIQPRSVSRNHAGPTNAATIINEVLWSPGQRLEPAARSFFEPRFGCDFSKVRVHADERAASAAEATKARAFTSGHNIVFGRNEYPPRTESQRKLLAHELTHVVQQQGHRNLQIGEPVISLKPDLRSEKGSPRAGVFGGEFLVQDQKGQWFVFEISCTMTTTTALDKLTVKTAGIPARSILNFSKNNCFTRMTPLEEYEAEATKQGWAKVKRQFASRQLESGAIRPAYIEFDLIFLWKQPAEYVLSKVFSEVGLGLDLLSGDYTGGPAEAIKDGILGSIAEKQIVKLYKIPPSGNKLEIMKEIAKGELKKAMEPPKRKPD